MYNLEAERSHTPEDGCACDVLGPWPLSASRGGHSAGDFLVSKVSGCLLFEKRFSLKMNLFLILELSAFSVDICTRHQLTRE